MNFARISLIFAAQAGVLLAQESPRAAFRAPTFPPPNPPPIWNSVPAAPRFSAMGSLYSIGEPTAEEQFYVELVNRARANPPAEAQRLAAATDPKVLEAYRIWDVDLELLASQFAVYAPTQPLAISGRLTAAARRHSADMLGNAFQEHTGSDGSNPGTRASDTGYNFFTVGENIYANAESVFHGHAGFEVDWGPGPGGMQTPPGHRDTIHRAAFREIGVGVSLGRNSRNGRDVGPQVVTQDFGAEQGGTPLITGVAYYDLNGNEVYDIGEGIGGVSVKVSGAAAEAVTALSGGYAIPVSGNQVWTVTFSGAGFAPLARAVTVSNLLNQKADFIPAYLPPVISGSSTPIAGRANGYAISPVGGATAYEWRSFEQVPARAEGAENGTGKVVIEQSAGYEAVQGQVKAGGNSAFHLAHPQAGAVPQSIALNPTYQIGANGSVSFQSRLGWAGGAQTARVQISTDGGASWVNIYNQSGTDNAGEAGFSLRAVSLAPYAGRQARVRFLYDIGSGNYFPQTESGVGWYLDDIQFAGVDEVTNNQSGPAPGAAFDFAPAKPGNYVLLARARTGHAFLDWGPAKAVTATGSGVPELRISRMARVGADLQIMADVTAGTAGAVTIEAKERLGDPWGAQAATVQSLSATRFLISVPVPAAQTRFFRVKSAEPEG